MIKKNGKKFSSFSVRPFSASEVARPNAPAMCLIIGLSPYLVINLLTGLSTGFNGLNKGKTVATPNAAKVNSLALNRGASVAR